MKRTIRIKMFETNSSSTHSCVLMKKSDFDDFEKSKKVYVPESSIKWYGVITPNGRSGMFNSADVKVTFDEDEEKLDEPITVEELENNKRYEEISSLDIISYKALKYGYDSPEYFITKGNGELSDVVAVCTYGYDD